MSQQFRTVTTNAGRNAIRAALAQGKTVKLSHMSVGDGGGNPVTPLATMTALVNERFRAQINDITLDPATPDLFTSELFIPQAEGGWYIREVGLWMDDGTLFAVGNTPLTEKPDLSSARQRTCLCGSSSASSMRPRFPSRSTRRRCWPRGSTSTASSTRTIRTLERTRRWPARTCRSRPGRGSRAAARSKPTGR